MKIGFIGAGKVGFSLGKYLTAHNITVSGYYSRNPESSKEAAAFTNTKYYNDLSEIINESDTLFLTIPDGEIPEVYSKIIQSDISGKCIAHCSGALSSGVFFDIGSKGAKGCSVHPICAVCSKYTGYHDLSKAYFTVEGECAETMAELLRSCGNTVERISAENKVKYHAAAVFASNLVTGLYDISVDLLKDCGLSDVFSEKAFKTLFLGNATNIVATGSVDSLTGPVERADCDTVRKHLESLQGSNKLIYMLVSRSLINVAMRKNPDRDYSGLYEMLTESGSDF